MIAEQERDEVLTTLAQTQNEALFQQVLVLVRQQRPTSGQSPRQQIAPPGYAHDDGFWMADDFDEPLEDLKSYM